MMLLLQTISIFLQCILLHGTLVYGLNRPIIDQFKTVDTTSGQVRGIQETTLLRGVSFYSFKGIPYAEPPVGNLRFKPPEPIKPWNPATFDAFEYGNICIQYEVLMSHPFPMSEDCLTLNVFVPAHSSSDEKLAVLFFVHGGGFIQGAGDDFFYGPDFIIEKNTILVTINYRLGIFGFLALNSTEYSGNMGLKDQQLALKWIHANIGQFGGDNQRITIFGHSAGAASVNAHIFSSESRKYFQNAVPMSGSIGNYWAFSEDEHHLKHAFRIAEQLGKPHNSIKQLIVFLKTVPADQLNQQHFYDTSVDSLVSSMKFGPVIERRDAKHPFFVESPDKMVKSRIKINTMFTILSAEMISLVPKPTDELLNIVDKKFNAMVQLPFKGLKLAQSTYEYHNMTNAVRRFYFGDASINKRTISQFFNLLNDLNFAWGINQSVKTLATNSIGKTFFVRFSVDSKLNVWKNLDLFNYRGITNLPGAGHGDDLCYLFRCSVAQGIYHEILNGINDAQSKICLQTIETLTRLFTNFAKFGVPLYDEPSYTMPVHNKKVDFLDITNNGITAGFNPYEKTVQFWQNLQTQSQKYGD